MDATPIPHDGSRDASATAARAPSLVGLFWRMARKAGGARLVNDIDMTRDKVGRQILDWMRRRVGLGRRKAA